MIYHEIDYHEIAIKIEIPLKLQQLKKLFGLPLINLRILFLKIPKCSELGRLGFRLFHSMIDDGKKEFL